MTRTYLLTISCQQKKLFVCKKNLDEVIRWISDNNNSFVILHHSYERSGKYSQLHFHALVSFKGYWKPYTQWGDLDYTHLSFRIQWVKIRDAFGAINYIYKDTLNNKFRQEFIHIMNHYKYNYFNIDTQLFQPQTVS